MQYFFRFKVKVEVIDEECLGVFIIFDSDMSHALEKSCAQLVTVAKVLTIPSPCLLGC
jgi:hypothetical protein